MCWFVLNYWGLFYLIADVAGCTVPTEKARSPLRLNRTRTQPQHGPKETSANITETHSANVHPDDRVAER